MASLCRSAVQTFQSTPGSEEPGDVARTVSSARIVVSIHARLRGAGRRGVAECIHGDDCFNPRPAPRSRATSRRIAKMRPTKFQSTPGSEEPGDVAPLRAWIGFPVSIHARLRGAGRRTHLEYNRISGVAGRWARTARESSVSAHGKGGAKVIFFGFQRAFSRARWGRAVRVHSRSARVTR